MKKELILSALMGSSMTHSLSAQQIDDLLVSASSLFANNIGSVFISKDIYDGYRWEYGDDVSRSIPIKVRYRISINEFGGDHEDYYYDGPDQFEYEILIEQIDEETGEVVISNRSSHFARHLGGSQYRIFECDASSICRSSDESKFYISDTPEGRIMKLNTGESWLRILGLPRIITLLEK